MKNEEGEFYDNILNIFNTKGKHKNSWELFIYDINSNNENINRNIISKLYNCIWENQDLELALVIIDFIIEYGSDSLINEIASDINALATNHIVVKLTVMHSTTVNKIIKSYDKDIILAGEGPLTKDLVDTTETDLRNVSITSIAVIFIIMLLVLKSITLPILLVTAIEFAIFINMGVPYFMGTKLPFVASVVIGTIQRGATIDYAILLTTKYLEERKNKDKKEAVKSALDNSVSSIIVSAMCFFGATVGVGIVSKVDMIGSLCILLCRGALISMLVVICIVPSLLLIFDKLIVKTTLLKTKTK